MDYVTVCIYYRPHPNDGEGNVFTGVCPFTPGGGVPQSQVLSQVSGRRCFLTRTGAPSSQYRTGVPPSQDRTRVPPWLGLGYPSPAPPPKKKTEQQSEHLLRGRQYASCVHAGGLSCWWLVRATYVVDGRFFGHFFWKVVGTVRIHVSHVQLPYTVINVWVEGAFTCGT